MTPAAVVTIIAVVLVILVIVGFLLAIARALVGIDKTLGTVIDAVGAIAVKTEPVAYAVDSLNSNLDNAKGTLSSLLASKVGAAGAAQLVASVDPLAATPAASPGPARAHEPERINYKRASPAVAEAEPASAARVNPRTGTPRTGTQSPSEPEPVTESPERPFPGAGGETRLGGLPIKR